MRIFGRPANRVPTVEPTEASALLQQGALMLDVREPFEHASGAVPGALLVPLGELQHRMGELDRERQVLAICRSGGRSARATSLLRSAGFDAVNVAGGIERWLHHGLPVEGRGGRPRR